MAAKFEDQPGRRVADTVRIREGVPSGGAAEKSVTAADTIPPMPLKDLLSAGGANLFVFSTDAELIDTVQRAGGEHYPVFAVSEWLELELAIDTGRCGIALLDANLLGATITARIAALERHSQRLVVLVAADRATAQALMSLLSDRKIHRLLIKPPALGITRLLVESAVNRCLQLRELAKGAGDPDLSLPSARERPRRRVPAWIFLAAGAALFVGVGTIVAVSPWWRATVSETVTPLATEAAGTTSAQPGDRESAEQPRFAELLARAEQAFGAGRLAVPPGDNALDYYLVILAADPTEPVAREQLGRVIDALFAQAEEALLANAHDAAGEALKHVRRADPTSGRLAFLDAQLERARAAALAAAAAAAPPARARPAQSATQPPAASATSGDFATQLVAAARVALESADIDAAVALAAEAKRQGAGSEALVLLETELATARAAETTQRHAEWLALAETRLGSGMLFAPEEDSALHYLEQIESQAAGLAGLDSVWDRWRIAVVADVQRALAARDWDRAETTLAALQRAPQGGSVSAPLRAELEFGRLQEQYLATAAPASELSLIERAPAVYPPEALQREIEGWVDVEFVVDTGGRPRDPIVVAAEPRGRFEGAALAAIREYRYRPFERDGRLFERRVRLRTRFTLQ